MKCTMLFNKANKFVVKRDFVTYVHGDGVMPSYYLIYTETEDLLVLETPKKPIYYFTNIME